LLRAQGLCAWYGAAQILFDVDLEVRRGEVVALMGRNGAGKSTTLKALMGMLTASRGSVSFMGQDISKSRTLRGVAPGPGLRAGRPPHLHRPHGDGEPGRRPPARSHLARGQRGAGVDARRLFQLFPNLGEMPTGPGGRMSGGEQQMLTVARTLMGNPYLVLLDEPSEGVAPVIVEQMATMILELKAQGVSILLSEQNMHFAELVSDRAYVLEKGQIRYQAPMAELAGNDEVRRNYLSV
jgi:branched-chain amino acid transport system ATP-binding protein